MTESTGRSRDRVRMTSIYTGVDAGTCSDTTAVVKLRRHTDGRVEVLDTISGQLSEADIQAFIHEDHNGQETDA